MGGSQVRTYAMGHVMMFYMGCIATCKCVRYGYLHHVNLVSFLKDFPSRSGACIIPDGIPELTGLVGVGVSMS